MVKTKSRPQTIRVVKTIVVKNRLVPGSSPGGTVKTLNKKGNIKNTLDISELPKGVYIFTSSDNSFSKKFLSQNIIYGKKLILKEASGTTE